MPISITIHISDDLYERAKRFAHLANRDIASVITESMPSALPPMGAHIDALPSDRSIEGSRCFETS
jgi:predicted transcriptional regulator